MMKLVTVLPTLMILISCGSNAGTQYIKVKKKLAQGLGIYSSAYIESRNPKIAESKLSKFDNWAMSVRSEVFDVLKAHGLKPYVKEMDADLIVRCIFSSGCGLPRFGRHFDLITEYIDFVSIKLIDSKTNKLIGEVEYRRPFLAKNPPHLVRDMMNALTQSGSGRLDDARN